MLSGNLVRVRFSKARAIPLYLDRTDPQWLEVAESLLLIFREGVGRTRGEIDGEIDEMLGEGLQTLAHRGLAKILEDRSEFEVVADVPPETLREKVFGAAAAFRRAQIAANQAKNPFRRDVVLDGVAAELKITPEQVAGAMFADLRDENRLLSVDQTIDAVRLVDRYNVSLAQSILLRSVLIEIEVRNEKPARYRKLFQQLKFHRLLYRVEGTMREGYKFHIDGPLSLFSATNRYGMQMALFLPALLQCNDFRLDAELRWGPRREPRSFHLDSNVGLVAHYADSASYVPAELTAFLDRFRQVATQWSVEEATTIVDLGREGSWIPDLRFIHLPTGKDVFVEVVGFWKRTSLDRLLRLLPQHGPERYILAIADSHKVDEEALEEFTGPVLRFREIPNAPKMLEMLNTLIHGEGKGRGKKAMFD